MEQHGPVVQVVQFFLFMDAVSLLVMESGLLLEMVETVLRQALMEPHGPVWVIPFFLQKGPV
jgi:hypothetical protein